MRQVTIIFSGKVHYVGFRRLIESIAEKHFLSGVIYNDLEDKTVKLLCEGEETQIKEFIEEVEKHNGLDIKVVDRIILPKRIGRVVIDVERDIFERLDLE